MSSPVTIRGIEIEMSARNNNGEFMKEMCENKAERGCGVCEKKQKREKDGKKNTQIQNQSFTIEFELKTREEGE